MTVVKWLRVPEELEAKIAARAAKEGRSWANMVVHILTTALRGKK